MSLYKITLEKYGGLNQHAVSPVTMKSAADDEFYYSKLPDYYVGTFSSTKGTKTDNVKEKENDITNDTESCYDKIPPYLSGLRENRIRCNIPQNLTIEESDDTAKSSAGLKLKGLKHTDERRIIYVGNVSQTTTLNDLRLHFAKFGPIEEVKLHFREIGDSYGFVTFVNEADAFAALKSGTEDSSLSKYDLCFGGRRLFCRNQYADLDAIGEEKSVSQSRSHKIRPIL